MAATELRPRRHRILLVELLMQAAVGPTCHVVLGSSPDFTHRGLLALVMSEHPDDYGGVLNLSLASCIAAAATFIDSGVGQLFDDPAPLLSAARRTIIEIQHKQTTAVFHELEAVAGRLAEWRADPVLAAQLNLGLDLIREDSENAQGWTYLNEIEQLIESEILDEYPLPEARKKGICHPT
jgi:hypothetical protein